MPEQQVEISLRRFTMDDIGKIFEMSREDSLARFLPDQVYRDHEEASRVVEYLIRSYDESSIEKGPYVLGVVLNKDRLIGHVGVSRIEEGIEIGYAIEKKHQGLGYAQKAVSQMLQILAANTKASEIYGIVDPENKASIKVLEKCGFLEAGERLDKIVYKKKLTHVITAQVRME